MMHSAIKKDMLLIPRAVARKNISEIERLGDVPPLDYKTIYSSRASFASTVITQDFSDSDYSSCDSFGVGACESDGVAESTDQEEDEPTFSYGDDIWDCVDDDTTRRTSDESCDEYAGGRLTRCFSSFEETNHEEFRVRFKDTVDVREFDITVGRQGHSSLILCPITLDWYFSQKQIPLKGEQKTSSKNSVKKLTEWQRRSWVSHVRGWSPEQVRSLEIDRVVETMEEVMQRQETFIDNLIEYDDEEGFSDHSDCSRDWDDVLVGEYKDSSETSLLNVSRDFGVSFSNFDDLSDDESLY